jgi:hypothetical protein
MSPPVANFFNLRLQRKRLSLEQDTDSMRLIAWEKSDTIVFERRPLLLGLLLLVGSLE